jgi:hypothetical protein
MRLSFAERLLKTENTMDKLVLPNGILLGEVEKLLSEGKEVSFTPRGNSMLPFLRGGEDSVVLCGVKDIEVGDMLLVRLSDRYVLHRVWSIDGEKVVMMGDGNIRGKEKCLKKDVVGKVREIHKRKSGKTVIPDKGRIWRMLLPVRRYILWLYKKIWPVSPLPEVETEKTQ